MRILSGIQPSGKLHIGNYLGMIRQMIEFQDRGELFCFLANMHSLTTIFDGQTLVSYTREALLDLLALGIDPDRSTLWVQSDVPEVAELTWYLNAVTPMGLLQRSHSFKDKIAKDIPASNGLFSYPVLMAADILLYRSDIVPVGKDQKQHVEITRDIAVKFNAIYGEIFTLPKPEIHEDIAVIPGTDGQKMSKSYGNTIEIFASEKELKERIMGIVTDSTPLEEPKDPDRNIIYAIYKLFASKERASEMAEKFRAGGYGYGHAKKELLSVLLDFFKPYREKRKKIESDGVYLEEVRKKGEQKARKQALEMLEKVRAVIGVKSGK